MVGKLLEEILRDGIYQSVDRHRLIRDSEHGFGSGKLSHIFESFFEEA